jgi:hypothetical protein
MSKTFADHLLNKHEIHAHLDLVISDPEEKAELINLIEDIFTHHLLDTSLQHLPKTHHNEFLELLKKDLSDPKILKFLKDKIEIDIEKEIDAMSKKVKKEILQDLHKSGFSTQK